MSFCESAYQKPIYIWWLHGLSEWTTSFSSAPVDWIWVPVNWWGGGRRERSPPTGERYRTGNWVDVVPKHSSESKASTLSAEAWRLSAERSSTTAAQSLLGRTPGCFRNPTAGEARTGVIAYKKLWQQPFQETIKENKKLLGGPISLKFRPGHILTD